LDTARQSQDLLNRTLEQVSAQQSDLGSLIYFINLHISKRQQKQTNIKSSLLPFFRIESLVVSLEQQVFSTSGQPVDALEFSRYYYLSLFLNFCCLSLFCFLIFLTLQNEIDQNQKLINKENVVMNFPLILIHN
jgi:hypothetical protein